MVEGAPFDWRLGGQGRAGGSRGRAVVVGAGRRVRGRRLGGGEDRGAELDVEVVLNGAGGAVGLLVDDGELVLVVRKPGYQDRTVRKPIRDGRVSSTVTLLELIPETTPDPTPEPPTPDVGEYKDNPYE